MNQFPYERREYDIVSYDLNWPVRFEAIASKLMDIWGGDALDIQHIGSTSIPGMEAKSVIDVLLTVATIGDLDSHKQEMGAAGYLYEGQMVKENSRLYREVKDGKILTHIHVFLENHPHVSEMLRLRDHLRTHLHDVEEYSKVKKTLREKYPNEYSEYRKQKDEYLNNVLKKKADI